jgi:hypothetical protein
LKWNKLMYQVVKRLTQTTTLKRKSVFDFFSPSVCLIVSLSQLSLALSHIPLALFPRGDHPLSHSLSRRRSNISLSLEEKKLSFEIPVSLSVSLSASAPLSSLSLLSHSVIQAYKQTCMNCSSKFLPRAPNISRESAIANQRESRSSSSHIFNVKLARFGTNK